MAPKRKAVAGTKGAKKVKTEPEDAFRLAKEVLQSVPKGGGTNNVDAACYLSRKRNAKIYANYACILNQTNTGSNKNKFYIIQVIKVGTLFYCWNRWGNVGQVGHSKLSSPYRKLVTAKADFLKKFKDKTKNDWKNKDNFKAHPGKYTLNQMKGKVGRVSSIKVSTSPLRPLGDRVLLLIVTGILALDLSHTLLITQGPLVMLPCPPARGGKLAYCKVKKRDTVDGRVKRVLPCTLDKPTQELIHLIVSKDMFNITKKTMNLDFRKLALCRLNKTKLVKGLEALEELEKAHKKKSSKAKLRTLSFHFYTIISRKIGYKRLSVISPRDIIQVKKKILMVLADIQQAENIQAEAELEVEEIPHPIDQDYKLLKCSLKRLDEKSENYQIIKTYLSATGSPSLELLSVWEVDRHKEDERFKTHDGIENRRLLWHGTKMASIAAILKSGLRIMPHSGGRVGKGIYFASEYSKSESFVWRTSNRIGIMFLNEVALGKEYTITTDDSTLVRAPNGYDCVVARGRTEPNASKDTSIILDGKKVMVPQGKPRSQKKYSTSYFSQSEYVIYKESQCRIRYLLQLKF
ncbi:PARP3 polymerase, partial [Polypterus senegalus]